MILNIETGRVYETAASAARAAGVGASGISKVLSGKQRATKGYHFLRVEVAPEKAALTQIRRQTTKAQTKAQRERYAAARKAASAAKRQRDRAARQEAKAAGKPKRQRRPAAPSELREARAKLREAMIRANRIAAAAERSGEKRMQGYVQQIRELAGSRAGIPNKRTGLFLTSPQAVADITYTEADAYQMIAEIEQIEQQYTQQIQGISAALEAQYGLRPGEGAAKRQALQNFGRAMGLLRELAKRSSGDGKYKQIYELMTQGDAQAATAEQIEQIAQEIMDYVDRAREYERAEIDAIMDAWKSEVYGSGDDEDEDGHRGGEYIPWDD